MAALSDEICFYQCFITGLAGLMANIFLLVLVLRKQLLRQQEYMPFVINRALIDVVFGLHAILLQPLGIRYYDIDPIYCTVAGGFFSFLLNSALCFDGVLAFNRFIAICHQNRYQQIYTKRRVYGMCVSTWALSILIASMHATDDSFGRTTGFFCLIKFEKKFLLVMLVTGYSYMFLIYSVIVFCYCKVFLFIRRHQAEVSNNNLSTTIADDKSLLRYIGAIALLPLVVDTPATVIASLHIFNPNLLNLDVAFALSGVLVFLCPLINALFTLYMLRPIRKEVRVLLKQLSKDNSVAPINLNVQSIGVRSVS